jgi:para-aminobenzoate synthetase component 1
VPPPPRHTHCALREIRPAPDPLAVVGRLRDAQGAWFLDSASSGGRLARYSFLGCDPYAIARLRGRELKLEVRREADPRFPCGQHRQSGDVLALLRALLPRRPEASAPDLPFAGGAVGYLGYELAEQLDVHRLHGRDDLGLPDAAFLLVDRLVAFDHRTGRAFVLALGLAERAGEARERAELAADQLLESLAAPQPTRPTRATPQPAHAAAEPLDVAAYAKGVDAIQQEISAGNVYQACLTARTSRHCDVDPWQLYQALRRVNPAPFACFFELPEVAILGSSPERFLRVDRTGNVESRPIKGTAPRGRDAREDAARRDALARSPKDRAENLMIVDLVRNDLGRVCETGSVHVSELMAIEAYASVFQMVSTVRGRLAPDRDVFDALGATFPPGSMTGAPKIAAMRILDRLEPMRRSIYSGAIGYLDVWGGADLSVVIRTLLLREGRALLHAGGGIVADSDAAAEVREVLLKLRPLEDALTETLRDSGEAEAPR